MQKLLVCNTLDAMHIERNISANVQKHLSREKDTLAVQCNMQEVGASPHLWLRPIPGINNFIKPKAPYVFTPTENTDFINHNEMPTLKTYVAETLCLMELWFSPGFFNITTHLIIHLVEEVEMCRPVHAWWCYAVEQYLGVLTEYVRDKSKPDASMATGYSIDESLGFYIEYFALYPHTRRRVWGWEEEQKNEGEVTLGKATLVRLTDHKVNQIHEYIIMHSVVTAELYRYVMRHPFVSGIFFPATTFQCGR